MLPDRPPSAASESAGGDDPVGPDFELLAKLTGDTSGRPLGDILARGLEVALAWTGCDRGFALLLDRRGQPAQRARCLGGGAVDFDPGAAEACAALVRQVVTTGSPATTVDGQGVAAPLVAGGKILGAIYLDRVTADAPSPTATALAPLIAHLTLLLDHARLARDRDDERELLGLLVHEVRNPLSAILGFAEIGRTEMLEGMPRGEASEMFARIRRDGERLERLVEDIMDLVRHSTGKLEWIESEVDLSSAVNQAVEPFRQVCYQRNVELEVDSGRLGGRVQGSEPRLVQVVSGMLTNAVRFTPKGGRIRLFARVEHISSAESHAPPIPPDRSQAWSPARDADPVPRPVARLDLIDDGPRVAAGDADRLFDARGHGTHRAGGTSLVLHLCRAIVQRHGGTMWAESAPDQRASFSLRLPLM